MANAEILKKYLVDENNGYLLDNNNNGKVIMLSGKWGSGKTHFWQKQIQTVLENKDKKIPNHYVSLYGKTSIQEIKNEIFLKVFESVDSYEVIEKGKALAKNTVDLISLFTKSVGIDLSKMTDKPFEKLENVLDDKKLKKTIEYLNSGAIICFDDFERKSKDIDLNDLFGFITQLTLNFDCKVVIILNDDVFEGEEKKIFSNVKEKSVSKFLKYEPSIEELFNLIFFGRKEDNKKKFKYLKLRKYRQIILKTIKETEELNARIYIQILDNLVEWVDKKQEINDDVLRCLIFVNINFVLFHIVLKICGIGNLKYVILKDFNDTFLLDYISSIKINSIKYYDEFLFQLKNEIYEREEKNFDTKNDVFTGVRPKNLTRLKINEIMNFIDSNEIYLKSLFFINKLNISENIDDKTFQKINNFIESGILINE